jgi:glycosyltransferase involved in cell wall biosynthesis
MDFRGGLLGKASYAVKTIYSREARVQIRKVLDDFKPDVCHLNNFNYQLTPSIILEIVKWRKNEGRECRIVYTAHDHQLVCPNHLMNNPVTHENCEKCLGGHFSHCFKDKCIHGSRAKSLIGMLEAFYWNRRGTYRYIDKIICCSQFLKDKMDTNPVLAGKTVALHNFIEKVQGNVEKPAESAASENVMGAGRQDYVLYFGRFSQEKGVGTLIEAAKRLPEIQFVCAGSGEYGQQIEAVPNMKNVGFISGEMLDALIRGAKFSLCPSECYENCPFSVMESQERGTPVVGARIGGIPELVDDGVNGLLFESGNVDSLVAAIEKLWKDEALCGKFEEACLGLSRDDVGEYVEKLRKITFE